MDQRLLRTRPFRMHRRGAAATQGEEVRLAWPERPAATEDEREQQRRAHTQEERNVHDGHIRSIMQRANTAKRGKDEAMQSDIQTAYLSVR